MAAEQHPSAGDIAETWNEAYSGVGMSPQPADDGSPPPTLDECERCAGTGRGWADTDVCPDCGGTGEPSDSLASKE